MKNRGHHARSRAKEHRNSLLAPFIEKQYRVLGMRARLICLGAELNTRGKVPYLRATMYNFFII